MEKNKLSATNKNNKNVQYKISLKKFLKTYTLSSDAFIDEFYVFYEMCDNEKYGILLNDVIKFLEIKNENKFISSLRDNYTENVDYIKKHNQKQTQYYIDLDTFERICMVSNSVKANKVREYFLILRKFIQYYKDYISDMILANAIKNPNGHLPKNKASKNKSSKNKASKNKASKNKSSKNKSSKNKSSKNKSSKNRLFKK